jgi:tetratricopeptide (TPR) repeat protein
MQTKIFILLILGLQRYTFSLKKTLQQRDESYIKLIPNFTAMTLPNRIDLLRQYMAEDPEDPFSIYALSLEYIREGNDDEAQQLLMKLLDEHPTYVAGYYQYGKLLERKGHIAEAMIIYEKGKLEARAAGDTHSASELQAAIDLLAD